MPTVRAPRVLIYQMGFQDRLRTLAGLGQDSFEGDSYGDYGGESGGGGGGGGFSDWGGDSSSYETGSGGLYDPVAQPDIPMPDAPPPDLPPDMPPPDVGAPDFGPTPDFGLPPPELAPLMAEGYTADEARDINTALTQGLITEGDWQAIMGGNWEEVKATLPQGSSSGIVSVPDGRAPGKDGKAPPGGGAPPSSSAPGKGAPAPSPSIAQKKTPQGLKAVTDWLGQDSLVKGYPNALVAGGGFLAFTALTNMLGGGGKGRKR